MILTRESAGQRIHRRTVLEYALESQSQSASVTVSNMVFIYFRSRFTIFPELPHLSTRSFHATVKFLIFFKNFEPFHSQGRGQIYKGRCPDEGQYKSILFFPELLDPNFES
jgi:hypothetical protein